MKKKHYTYNKPKPDRWNWRIGIAGWHNNGWILKSYGPQNVSYKKNFYFSDGHGFRKISTFPEQRRNRNDSKDRELKHYGVYVKRRLRYPDLPNSWDDIHCGRWGGRSWKDFTKARKQYMKNFKD